ncbi:MAG: hypothetical protein HQ477_10110 [Chloroflexi bacterium]|jgi:hypothetical protein|nr:hypothetical protein [Chloroflexota bacterium]
MAPKLNDQSFRVLDPTAPQSVATDGMAERPESLAGIRVGLLRNDKLNSEPLLNAIYDVLADRFEVSGAYRVNKGDASRPADPDFLRDFSNEVDVAILANGD